MEISPYTAPFARLGKVRSAGVRDLGHANLRDEDWQPFGTASPRGAAGAVPLPAGVRCCTAAASRQPRAAAPGASIRGDGLVPVNSALGRHRDPATDLAFPERRRRVCYGMGHFDLLSRDDVYAQVRRWIDGR
jgi:hypothetical protein